MKENVLKYNIDIEEVCLVTEKIGSARDYGSMATGIVAGREGFTWMHPDIKS